MAPRKKEAAEPQPDVAAAFDSIPKQTVTVEDLPGVGPATATKLREAGYTSLESIAVASAGEIAAAAEIGELIAAKVTAAAKKAANIGGFKKGGAVLERRKQIGKLSMGVKALDDLFGGGIETQSISEFYGEFGSGKTQVMHQLAVNAQLPAQYGGLHGSVVMIDTENTFRPERIEQMVAGLTPRVGDDVDKDPAKFLERINVARAYQSSHQMLLVESASEYAEEVKDSDYPVRLLIVDSLTAHFRAEYVGRGTLADRQGKLNKHMHELLRFGDTYNSAVIVTNQVQANPAQFFGDPTKPVGGHIVGHTATFRTYIRKSKGDKRVFRLVDSPHLPEGEAICTVTTDGLRD